MSQTEAIPETAQQFVPKHVGDGVDTGESASQSLPPFTCNLLRVKVPVMVTLARKRQPVKSILELVPGSIIQFNKSCEEMLDLEISGRPAAVGECVKVGDKFGLRITSMIVPEEKFIPLKPAAQQR